MRCALLLTIVGLAVGDARSVPTGLVEQRSWHANGRLAEIRHVRDGHEEGLQQAWAEDGTLYINYEMRNGRRYGLMNARPCNPVEQAR